MFAVSDKMSGADTEQLSKPDCTLSSHHSTHAKGLGALLGTGDSPLSLLNGGSSRFILGCGKSPQSSKVSTSRDYCATIAITTGLEDIEIDWFYRPVPCSPCLKRLVKPSA